MEENLEKWVDELAELQLPALEYNKKRVERCFRCPSSAEPELSQIIGQDPGLLVRL